MKTLVLAVCTLALAACGTSSYLDKSYTPARAEFGDKAIPVPPEPVTPPHVEIINEEPSPNPGIAVEHITGTWTFTTPATVTRVEHKTAEMWQYSLYEGIPQATDTPFVVIQISKDPRTLAETDTGTYRVKKQRQYVMNGNFVQEWTGNTADGAGFSELLVRKPAGASDVCHAMAVARNDSSRKTALEILGSITWTPSTDTQPQ